MNCVYVFIIVALQYFVNDVRAGSSCEVPWTPPNTDTPQYIPDYYWRDYIGVIPKDALPGGLDKAGNPNYVGQVYTKEFELLPATIYSGCKSARTSAYNKELQSDKNVKILCAKDLDNFAWISTKNEETHLLTNCHLVIGGSEIGHNLNIGRVKHEGQTIIGKVFSSPLSNRGLWIPDNGKEAHFLTYEILTYNNCESQINSCRQCKVAPLAPKKKLENLNKRCSIISFYY